MLALLVFSCNEKREEIAAPPPADVLSEEEMTNILVDLHILEASINMQMTQDNRRLRDSSQYHNVYEKHNVTRAEVDESFRYYASKPEKLSAIYEAVVAKLNQMHTAAMQEAAKDTTVKLPAPPPIIK